MTRLRLQTALAILILPILASCTTFVGSTDPVVRIGLVAPFEGRHREIGYDVIYAGRLAVREWNARGGVQGYRVELVALDDGGDPEQAEMAARSLALDPMVLAVIGHWLDETTAAGRPIYANAKLPTIEMFAVDTSTSALSADFVESYREVTPLGESPGRYALAAYNACGRLIAAVDESISEQGVPTRFDVAEALDH